MHALSGRMVTFPKAASTILLMSVCCKVAALRSFNGFDVALTWLGPHNIDALLKRA
jgi:hypothetical protein